MILKKKMEPNLKRNETNKMGKLWMWKQVLLKSDCAERP
jgi:hypothetical protein